VYFASLGLQYVELVGQLLRPSVHLVFMILIIHITFLLLNSHRHHYRHQQMITKTRLVRKLRLRQKIRQLQSRRSKMTRKMKSLQSLLTSKSSQCTTLEDKIVSVLNAAEVFLTPMQLSLFRAQLHRQKRKYRWSTKEKLFALQLRYKSAAAFRFISNYLRCQHCANLLQEQLVVLTVVSRMLCSNCYHCV